MIIEEATSKTGVTSTAIQAFETIMERPAKDVSEERAKWAATSCQKKASGADETTLRLLRAVWLPIVTAVSVLYEGSLNYKQSLASFKLAAVL